MNKLLRKYGSQPIFYQFFRKMKLTILIVTISILSCLSAETYSQTTKLTITENNSTLLNVLRTIEAQSEFKFFYNEKVDVNKQVSVEVNQKSITDILDKVLMNSSIKYKVLGRQIALYDKNEMEPFISEQQGKKVTGKVTDTKGISLPGVAVVVKGTTIGVITDANGNYSLSNILENAIFQFSFVGMKMQEILVGNKATINITLAEEAIGLEEVVAIGYGTIVKKELTSALSNISSEDISKSHSSRLDQSIQGKASGVLITNTSGRPGADVTIRIRGSSTINNNNPLYVVDGIQTENIKNINPQDIESIVILKDASAAIYGAQAANGVVIVTTKKGKKGSVPKINFDFIYGFQELAKMPKLMGTKEFIDIYSAAEENDGTHKWWTRSDANIPHNTDWLSQIFHVAPISNTNFSLSGGNENTSYLISSNFTDQEGVMKSSGYKSVNFRVNTESIIAKRFTVGNTLTLGQEKWKNPGGAPSQNEIFISAMRAAPTVPVYWTQWDIDNNPVVLQNGWKVGDYAGPTRAGEHPGTKNTVGFIDNNDFDFVQKQQRMLGTLYGELKIAEHLKFKSTLGIDYSSNDTQNFQQIWSYGTKNNGGLNNLLKSYEKYFFWSFDNTLTYDFSINNNHNFNLLLGSSARRSTGENLSTESSNFADESLRVTSASGNIVSAIGTKYQDSWTSYLGRLNYNFKEKYLFQSILRADGSSKFGSNNRFGYFPSLSGGWRISEEKFFPKDQNISNLKIRGSYGQTGNDRINRYASVEVLNFGSTVFGTNQDVNQTVKPVKMGNPDLKWEATTQLDIGLDIGLFNNSVEIIADYFNKKTTDMLYQKPIPLTAGITGFPWANLGNMRNSGLEFSLTYHHSGNEFNWDASANFGTIQNKVLKIENDIFNGVSIIRVGEPLGSFYGLVTEGLFQNQEEINAYTFDSNGDGQADKLIQPFAKPGDIRFKDLNNDGSITSSDREIIGNPFPDFTYGVNFHADYKHFDFSIFFQGVYGNSIYRSRNGGMDLEEADQRGNVFLWAKDYWTPENPNKDVTRPRPTILDKNGNRQISDRYVSNGSYLRIKNIQLGYNLPANICNHIGLDRLRIYLSGNNLLTFTNYIGFDPEIGGENLSNLYGVDDFTSYPQSRTIQLGIQINL